jgi:hypothetical protein
MSEEPSKDPITKKLEKALEQTDRILSLIKEKSE